ncbi:MAG: hypothetical protein KAS81_04730, partial [Anaerolineales bacterium]|nr:hypothetical protein [Anaerolineales bacterium]
MSFDTLSTAVVLRGRVQRVVQVDQLSLGPEIYGHRTRRRLPASADARYPRPHLWPTALALVHYGSARNSHLPIDAPSRRQYNPANV